MQYPIVLLLTAILLLSVGCVTEEKIETDAGLFGHLPDKDVAGITYLQTGEKLLSAVGNNLGQEKGGENLKKIKGDVEMVLVTYKDNTAADLFYFKSMENATEVIELIDNIGAEDTRTDRTYEKIYVGGQEYTIATDGMGQKICAWKKELGVILLNYRGEFKEDIRSDCTDLIEKTYDSRKIRDKLAEPEEIGRRIGSTEGVHTQVWITTEANPIIGFGGNGEKLAAYGRMTSDDIGSYMLFAVEGGNPPTDCSGEVIKRDGKQACFTEGIAMLSIVIKSLQNPRIFILGAERKRIVENITLHVQAVFIAEEDSEAARERALDIIFAVPLQGEEGVWEQN